MIVRTSAILSLICHASLFSAQAAHLRGRRALQDVVPISDLRRVACGRGADGEGGLAACPEGDSQLVAADSLHEVRCCRDGAASGWKQQCADRPGVYARSTLDGQCHAAIFEDARALCDAAGGRICTADEVLDSCAKGTGCNHDRELVWACAAAGAACGEGSACCSGRCGPGGQCLLWPDNVVENPGFEGASPSPWRVASDDAGAALALDASERRAGARSVLITGRTASWNGVRQDLFGKIAVGVAYQISCWVKLKNAPSSFVKLALLVEKDTGTDKPGASATVSSTEWTKLERSITISSTGTLTNVAISIQGPAAGVEYYVDNVEVLSLAAVPATGPPTGVPTVRPSASPTPNPSKAPTTSPTASPTPNPSKAPTTSPTASPGTSSPSPPASYCMDGILNSNGSACCAASCGRCGGSGCGQLPGGGSQCCSSAIVEAGRTCSSFSDTACLLPNTSSPTALPTKIPTTSPTETPTTAPNLVVNSGFEDTSLSPWYANFGGEVTLDASQSHSGHHSVLVKGRTAGWNGVEQDVYGRLSAGAEYQLSCWVKLKNASSSFFKLTLQVTKDTGKKYPGVLKTVTSQEWTEITGTVAVEPGGTITDLAVFVEGPDPGVDYYVDDVAILPVTTTAPTAPQPAAPSAPPTRLPTPAPTPLAGAPAIYGDGPFVSLASSSEIVTIPRPPRPADVAEPRTGCPHEQAGLLDWHDAATWSSVSK